MALHKLQLPNCFYKDVKNLHWRKDSLFNKWHEENLISTCKTMKQNPYISVSAQINLN